MRVQQGTAIPWEKAFYHEMDVVFGLDKITQLILRVWLEVRSETASEHETALFDKIEEIFG